jgi:hypothetical protein
MANTLSASALVARESVPVLKNLLSFSKKVNRKYEDEFAGAGRYSPGQTINIKRPPRYTYRAGRSAIPQDTVVSTIPLTLNQGGCDIYNTGLDLTVLSKALDKQLEAALATVANEIDRQGLEMARYSAFNVINPTGTVPSTQALAVAAATDCYARLSEMGAPKMDRCFIANPKTNGYLVAGMSGMFNSVSTISGQNQSGEMKNALGFDFGWDQNVNVHTNGAATATNINGANQTGSSITVVAVAGGTLTKGTIITLPGVFAVNPQTRVTTGSLANFIVTADALAGATTINISPAIVTSGQFQNVTASPTTAAPYVIQGAASTSYAANIAYAEDAFTLAMVNMHQPSKGTGASSSMYSEDGFTVKVTEYYDGAEDTTNMRLDILFGWAATYPELACRFHVL